MSKEKELKLLNDALTVITGRKHYASVGEMLENKFSELGYKDDNGKEIIVELYKEFLDEENTLESCICCCHSFVDKDGFYNCGLGNFHVCCGGVNCKDFEINSFIKACFEKIKNLKAEREKMKSDVMDNIKWADKNCEKSWQKLMDMWNEWEYKYGK